MNFYNYTGEPVAYSVDESIYLFDGTPVGYFANEAIYNYGGKHVGWFKNGWIRDLNGDCVFYSNEASGGPIKPVSYLAPIKAVKKMIPAKYAQESRKAMNAFSSSWSKYSDEKFFN